jgi:hypothetical protein
MSDPTTSTAAPGWYPDNAESGLLRYWDGQKWAEHVSPAPPIARDPAAVGCHGAVRASHRLRNGVIIGGCAAVVLFVGLAIVGAALNSHDKQGAQPPGRTAAQRSEASPVSPMFDPHASKAQTVASIKQDYCKKVSVSQPLLDQGFTMVMCTGPSGSFNGSVFDVYSTPQAVRTALASGAVSCFGGKIAVIGTDWAATLVNPDDAAVLVKEGASTGTCG